MKWPDSPCEAQDLAPVEQVSINEYCGYRRGFTKHDWCSKYYVGLMLNDGTITRCGCPCHQVWRGLFP